jgi:hypothetical protein
MLLSACIIAVSLVLYGQHCKLCDNRDMIESLKSDVYNLKNITDIQESSILATMHDVCSITSSHNHLQAFVYKGSLKIENNISPLSAAILEQNQLVI